MAGACAFKSARAIISKGLAVFGSGSRRRWGSSWRKPGSLRRGGDRGRACLSSSVPLVEIVRETSATTTYRFARIRGQPGQFLMVWIPRYDELPMLCRTSGGRERHHGPGLWRRDATPSPPSARRPGRRPRALRELVRLEGIRSSRRRRERHGVDDRGD